MSRTSTGEGRYCYCCYLLALEGGRDDEDDNGRRWARTYVGITNNLPRRLRQHNGS